MEKTNFYNKVLTESLIKRRGDLFVGMWGSKHRRSRDRVQGIHKISNNTKIANYVS